MYTAQRNVDPYTCPSNETRRRQRIERLKSNIYIYRVERRSEIDYRGSFIAARNDFNCTISEHEFKLAYSVCYRIIVENGITRL